MNAWNDFSPKRSTCQLSVPGSFKHFGQTAILKWTIWIRETRTQQCLAKALLFAFCSFFCIWFTCKTVFTRHLSWQKSTNAKEVKRKQHTSTTHYPRELSEMHIRLFWCWLPLTRHTMFNTNTLLHKVLHKCVKLHMTGMHAFQNLFSVATRNGPSTPDKVKAWLLWHHYTVIPFDLFFLSTYWNRL